MWYPRVYFIDTDVKTFIVCMALEIQIDTLIDGLHEKFRTKGNYNKLAMPDFLSLNLNKRAFSSMVNSFRNISN